LHDQSGKTGTEVPAVLVVGAANIDLVTRVPRCPKVGETLIGYSFATHPGGKGANQAVATARLGAKTYFAGCVGQDVFGSLLQRTLALAGVDVSILRTHPTEPTGTAVIFVDDQGRNSIILTPSANYGITPEDVASLKPMFEKVDVLLVQLEIPLETTEAALELARACRILSILDAGPAQKVPAAILQKADIVSPNETEAEAITDMAVRSLDDARAAAARLRDLGAKEVVLKLGESGALYMGEDWFHVPAFKVEPLDTVAAGDAFTAALAVAWKKFHDRYEAIRFANAAGAIATTVEGAQPSMPTRVAIETFLRTR